MRRLGRETSCAWDPVEMAGKGLQKHSQAFSQSSRRNWLSSDSVTLTKSASIEGGKYAAVCLGRCQGKSCAVKVPRMDVSKQLDKDLEIFSLESLTHPNLVCVMGIWEDPGNPGAPPCIVMEVCEISLAHYLRDNKSVLKSSYGSTSTTEIKVQILLDVVRGLIYLHQKGVFHGDLRSSNVFIQRESRKSDIPLAKISDYGFVQRMDPLTKVRRAEVLCEDDFLPPEILSDRSNGLKDPILTPQVDVFMFGDVALETATLEPVSRARKVTEVELGKRAILTEVDRRTESFHKIVQLGDKDAFIRLIKLCLAENPEQRLSTTDIESMLQHHLHYYQENPNAGERQDKAAECERLRAENQTEWKRTEQLKRQLKAFEDSKKQMKRNFGVLENEKEAQTQAVHDATALQSRVNELQGFITAQHTVNCLKVSDEVSALTMERDRLLKQVQELEQEKEKSQEQIEHHVTTIAKLQSRVDGSEADRDRLLQAKLGWTKEKEQLLAKQDELSRLVQSSVEKQSALLEKMSTFKGMLLRDWQEVAGLKSAVALDKESATIQFAVLQEEFKMVKKDILHAILERAKASHRAQQVLEVQLRTKFESDTADLREQLTSLSQERVALTSDWHQAQDMHKKAQHDYSNSQMKVDQLNKTVDEQATKISELKRNLYEAQAVEAGLKKQMATQTSEMEKLKEDQEKSEREHKKAFQSAIDELTKYHHAVFIDKAKVNPPPIDQVQDILSALNHKVDSKWNEFGVFLGVEPYTIEAIANDCKGASDCMLHLVSQWVTKQSGTGDHPRTWETVVKAVKGTGFDGLAQELTTKVYGTV